MTELKSLLACLCIVLPFLSACAPSQAELDSIATRVAAEIFATQTAAPPPTFTPTPVVIRLETDGSGAYATLEEAVQKVLEGGTILLGPGIYRLAQPLEVQKPLRLIGAGKEQTIIVSEAEGHVVRFSDHGPFTVEDIAFHHEGTAMASVVVVTGGEIAFARCRFTGAIQTEEEQTTAGLWLDGDTNGVVRDCAVEDNQTVGIYVGGQAQPTLEWNLCLNNTGAGIAYRGRSGGAATRNECTGNRVGISVDEQAKPALEWNLCADNSEAGIVYSGDSGGTARQNECLWNGVHGIVIGGRSEPTLESNICMNNKEAGIVYSDTAGGLAQHNGCIENGNGIYVSNEAQPKLEKNMCWGNLDSGIAYVDGSGGLAYRNECVSNRRYGIWVTGTAKPILESNDCYENGEEDIFDER